MVVHSLKDLPTSLPDGLAIAAMCEREDPRDAIIFHPRYSAGTKLASLPPGSIVGTSSLRRVVRRDRKKKKKKKKKKKREREK